MHPAPPDVPAWIQYVIVSAGGLAVFVSTILGYIKSGKGKSPTNDVAVVSATFADRRTIEGLSEALDRLERTMHEFSEESRRVRQSVDANTDAQINMTRFIKGHSV